METSSKMRKPITLEVTVYDQIVADTILKIVERHLKGVEEYGGTFTEEIEDKKKNATDYLIDAEEEIYDLLLYLGSMKKSLPEGFKFKSK